VPQKVVAQVGKPCYQATCGENGEMTTVVAAFNAIGTYIKAFIIMKGKRLKPEWLDGLPPDVDVVLRMSDNGWITKDLFMLWVEQFTAQLPKDAPSTKPTRTLTENKLLIGFLVSTTLGQQGSAQSSASQWDQERQSYFSLLDGVTREIGARFGETNLALFQSVEALLPSSEEFLKSQSVKPLVELLQLEQSALDAELAVGAAFFVKKLPKDSTLESAMKAVVSFKDAFPNLYALYAGASTIGVSTATCENSRILHPRRWSMKHQRKAQLVLLAFEKSLTRTLT